MMATQNTATIKTIFSDVLANLAFMFTDEAEIQSCQNQTWLETIVAYEGPKSGTLRFRCTREFAILLAANLLGIDPEDRIATSQDEDAIKEFMNIVCGQYVTAMHGTEDAYTLTIPHVTILPDKPDLMDDGGITTCTFCVDSHVVQLAYEPQANRS